MANKSNNCILLLILLTTIFGYYTGDVIAKRNNSQLTLNDSILIYYKYSIDGKCLGPISLGDFIKKTLPNEWEEGWGDKPEGMESLKAGAIAIRTFTISPYIADVITVNGQYHYCTRADWQVFNPDENPIDNPHSTTAVDATNGIIMTHPNVTEEEDRKHWPQEMRLQAIDAQYRDENGDQTAQGSYTWLKSIPDPISVGATGVNYSPLGMGQNGSNRWATGLAVDDTEYPRWDYRRILAHYYTDITFVGITPTPPEGYRSNIEILNGLPPNGGAVMDKGQIMQGVTVMVQNTGRWNWPVSTATTDGTCPDTEPFEGWRTLLAYHLYRQNADGSVSLACPEADCVGIRRVPLCTVGTLPILAGTAITVTMEIYMPTHFEIVEDENYLIRFDVEHRQDGVWEGYTAGYTWPPQDVPVYVPPVPDFGPPTNPGLFAVIDGQQAVNVWTNDNTISVKWDGASDAESGVYGYAVTWNTQANTSPPENVTTTAEQTESDPLTDGSWWLHLKTRDNAGNWAEDTAHYGPFLVDTTPPTITLTAPEWVITNTFPITWQAVDNFGLDYAGVVSVTVDYALNGGVWQPWLQGVLSSTLIFNHPVAADDVVLVRACAYDAAGNPQNECLYSTTHTQIRLNPYLAVTPLKLSHCLIQSDTLIITDTLQVYNEGAGQLVWQASIAISPTVVSVTPLSGTTTVTQSATLSYTATSYGTYFGPGAFNLYGGLLTITATSDVRRNPIVLPIQVRFALKADDCFDKHYLPLIFK